MARELNIRITADATQAQKALGQTEQSIKGITTESQKASTAVGTEKSGLMGAVGKLGMALAAVGATRAISRTVEWAGHLTDLADKTGMTTEALQRLAFVGGQSGVSIDTLANGIVRLQKNLSTDKGAQKAIEDLGLSVSELLAMAPDQMFIRLSEAVRKLEDPAQRTTVAWEALGRTSAELMPVMVSDVKALAESVHVTANDHTAALNQMGDNYARLKFAATTTIADILGGLADLKMKGDKLQTEMGLTWTHYTLSIVNAAFAMKNMVVEYSKQLYDGVTLWLVDKFKSIVDAAKGMTDQVAGFFKELYRKVVGGSYVPDMIRGIGLWFGLLKDVMVKPAKEGTIGVAQTFKDMLDTVMGAFRNILTTVSSAVSRIGGAGAAAWQSLAQGIQAATVAMQSFQTTQQAASAAMSAGIQIFATNLAQVIELGRQWRREGQEFLRTLRDFNADIRDLGYTMDDYYTMTRQWAMGGDLPRAGMTWFDEFLRRIRETSNQVSDALGNLTREAERFGGRAPNALQPMIATLLESTRLTVEQRRLLSGLQGDLGWEELQQAAERYGIGVDSLGNGFQQSRLGSIADQMFTDFTNLTEGGADPAAVLAGMADEMQTLVNDALRFGVALPEFLRPMLMQMTQANLLTDQFGNRLGDLSSLTFTDSIESSFQRMADILEQIRDLLARSIPDAADLSVRSVMSSMDKLSAATGGAVPGGDQRTHGFTESTGQSAPLATGKGGLTITVPVMLNDREIARSVANVARQLGYG